MRLVARTTPIDSSAGLPLPAESLPSAVTPLDTLVVSPMRHRPAAVEKPGRRQQEGAAAHRGGAPRRAASRDGAVWTSAGVTAGIDLALALVEEDLGRDHALAVAR
jgi:transcriptional regulator GlxA family with amidase domain